MLFFVASMLLLAAGGVGWLLDATGPADACWTSGTVLGLGASVAWTAGAVRRRQLSVDVIAVLALAGALAVQEPFAGAMITVMLASGRLLEARAEARARRELGLLLEQSPRISPPPGGEWGRGDPGRRRRAGRPPARGHGGGRARRRPAPGRRFLDEAALTGEPLPVERTAGDDVRSGVVNAGAPFDLVATTVAADSTYAGLVRLVEQAQAASAPFVRVADRLAVLFVPLTLLLAVAAWALSGEPGPRGRSARRRHAVPAATRRPDRDHLRAVPGRPHRSGHQGRWRFGAAGRRTGDAVRQDRHPYPGTSSARRRGHRGRTGRRRRAPPAGSVPGPGLSARARRARSSPPRLATG